jgi:hypothetical protein
MKDLITETITVIKKVDNFFLELEWHFAFSFQDVELEVHEKELKFETNEDRINYINQEKLFNNYFDWIYRRIDNHLLYQLQELDFAKALFFLERQRKFKESHYPDKRKINLYNDYLIVNVSYGDESIIGSNYIVGDYTKELLKIAFEVYKDYFNILEKRIEGLCELLQNTKVVASIGKSEQLLLGQEKFPNLSEKLSELDFFELSKTKILKEEQKILLIELLKEKSVAYIIAMFHHLGFIEHLNDFKYKKKMDLYASLSSILGSDPRTIRGQISTLNKVTNENMTKYTSHIHLADAIEDFKSINQEEA